MSAIEYIKFSEVNPDDLIQLLNNRKIREHLIDHEVFDTISIKKWINDKLNGYLVEKGNKEMLANAILNVSKFVELLLFNYDRWYDKVIKQKAPYK